MAQMRKWAQTGAIGQHTAQSTQSARAEKGHGKIGKIEIEIAALMDAKVKQTVQRKPANAVSLLVCARCTIAALRLFRNS